MGELAGIAEGKFVITQVQSVQHTEVHKLTSAKFKVNSDAKKSSTEILSRLISLSETQLAEGPLSLFKPLFVCVLNEYEECLSEHEFKGGGIGEEETSDEFFLPKLNGTLLPGPPDDLFDIEDSLLEKKDTEGPYTTTTTTTTTTTRPVIHLQPNVPYMPSVVIPKDVSESDYYRLESAVIDGVSKSLGVSKKHIKVRKIKKHKKKHHKQRETHVLLDILPSIMPDSLDSHFRPSSQAAFPQPSYTVPNNIYIPQYGNSALLPYPVYKADDIVTANSVPKRQPDSEWNPLISGVPVYAGDRPMSESGYIPPYLNFPLGDSALPSDHAFNNSDEDSALPYDIVSLKPVGTQDDILKVSPLIRTQAHTSTPTIQTTPAPRIQTNIPTHPQHTQAHTETHVEDHTESYTELHTQDAHSTTQTKLYEVTLVFNSEFVHVYDVQEFNEWVIACVTSYMGIKYDDISIMDTFPMTALSQTWVVMEISLSNESTDIEGRLKRMINERTSHIYLGVYGHMSDNGVAIAEITLMETFDESHPPGPVYAHSEAQLDFSTKTLWERLIARKDLSSFTALLQLTCTTSIVKLSPKHDSGKLIFKNRQLREHDKYSNVQDDTLCLVDLLRQPAPPAFTIFAFTNNVYHVLVDIHHSLFTEPEERWRLTNLLYQMIYWGGHPSWTFQSSAKYMRDLTGRVRTVQSFDNLEPKLVQLHDFLTTINETNIKASNGYLTILNYAFVPTATSYFPIDPCQHLRGSKSVPWPPAPNTCYRQV